MHFTTNLMAILALTSTVVLAQNPNFGPCVKTCITSHPTSSPCNGDETGSALDKCSCAGLVGSTMVKCIQGCPKDQVSSYAQGVPALCRDQLFPGSGGGSSAAGTTAATSAGGSSQTTSAAGGSASTTAGSATTGGSSSSSKTGSAAAATSSGAAPVNGVSGIIALGGVLAAMVI